MDLLSSTLLVLMSFYGAKSTFSPSGSVSIDCGGQRTFTCTLAANGPATWNIMGLQGIVATGSNGIATANNNARITSAETVAGLTSTIIITGFTAADNGGTIRCDDQALAVEGSATVLVVSTTLASATAVMANVNQCSANLTWIEPSNSSATTSVSCTPPSPQCSSCTSSGCTIGGLNSSTSYTFSVNRSRSGCDDSIAVSDETTTESVPSCPTNVSVAERSSDFSFATITWEQPANSPPVTSYDVTCNSSCTAIMPCSNGTSTCRILSVSPCEDYSVTVLTMNSCGSSTGCTENIVAVPSQGPPQCGTVGVVIGNDSCPSFTFTPQGSVLPSTVVVSYQLVGDPSSAGSLNCSYPVEPQMCELVVPEGTYTVRATPQNNCGSPSSTCPSRTVPVPAGCELVIASPSPSPNPVFAAAIGGVIGGAAAVVVIGVSGWCITILIMSCTCFAYLGFLALLKCLCCPCCKGKTMKSSSKQRIGSESPVTPPVTPPAQPPAQPPSDEYADPQAIRDRKERGQEDKDMIQYAAIDFSAGAGSGAGEVKIHQKEEPVIYTTVQHV